MPYTPTNFSTTAVINADTLFQNYDNEVQVLMSDVGDYLTEEMVKVYTETGTIVTDGIKVNSVETIEDLATQDGLVFPTIIVKDLNRGGTFIWSATGTANGGTVFAGATGYWNRQYSGAVNVKWFGAKGDGVASDVTFFQSAINSLPVSVIDTIYVPSGTYAGDMTTLSYGSRKIIWDFNTDVTFVSAFPLSTYNKLRSGDELSFYQSIVPSKHLKRFSTRSSTGGSGAIAGEITYSSGAIDTIAVATGGSYYASPRVIITGDGTGATATATVVAGTVTAINVTSGGSGYTEATVLIIDGPIVVVVGDSISVTNPTFSSPVYDGQYEAICRAFRQQNPYKSITFINRAIGAQTWVQFNGIPTTNLPSWYTNTSKAWLSYIQELQPDVVVMSFGMNDRQNFIPAYMRAAVATMLGWSTRPDLIFCTNMVSSAITTDPNLSSTDSQIGRDFVAGYVRGYALKNNHGLIDIHRQFRLIRDGEDHCNSALKYYAPNTTATLPYTFTNAGDGLFIKTTFDCSAPGFWENKAIEIQASYAGVNMVEWLRLSDTGGKLTISIQEYNGNGTPSLQVSYTTATSTPLFAGTVFEITISDNTFSVYVNGSEVLTTSFVRGGGVYNPVLRRVDITNPELPVSISDSTPVISSYAVGQYTQYQPRLDDTQIFGYGKITNFGGNRLNHPSSLAVKMIINPPIQNSNLTGNPVTVGTTSANVTTFTGINEPNPVAVHHITRIPYSASLFPPAFANTQVLEDATTVGQSMMTSSTGATRWNTGNESNATAFTMTYVHSNGVFTWAQNNTTLLGLLSTGTLYPNNDNTQSLGAANKKWSVVFAETGTINTSDERLKTFYDTEEAEKLCAKEIKGMMRKFKFNDSIIDKGEEKARIHFGVGAQSVKDVFEKYNLDAFSYAILCYDKWEEQEEIKDEEGNIIQEYIPAGDRYGIRYEELLCFIISAM